MKYLKKINKLSYADQISLALMPLTVTILFIFIKYTYRGIDFLDEGYYLLSLKNPSSYDWSFTLFGFFYHPFYVIFEENISHLRQFSGLLSYLLACIFCYQVLTNINNINNINKFTLFILSTCFGLLGFSYLFPFGWLPTPSYNHLCFQGILITFIGILLHIQFKKKSREYLASVLCGIGFWIVFMAKPPSAVFISLLIVAFLIYFRDSLSFILISIFTSFFLLMGTAFLIDGSIFKFIERLRLAIDFVSPMDHSIKNIIKIPLPEADLRIYLILLCITFAIVSIYFLVNQKKFSRYILSVGLFLYFLIAYFIYNEHFISKNLSGYRGLILLATPIAIYIIYLFKLRTIGNCSNKKLRLLSTLFLLVPFVYAFGSNNNYWLLGTAGAVFWVMSGLLFSATYSQPNTLINHASLNVYAVCVQISVGCLLLNCIEFPYGQAEPLAKNSRITEISPSGSYLMISDDYAQYVVDAVTQAKNAGFVVSTPVINLTGQTPGIVYSIGGVSLGSAWIIGGFNSSGDVAKKQLALVKCSELKSAWLLIMPDGRFSIPLSAINQLGLKLEDYELVASWMTPVGVMSESSKLTQNLYKPILNSKEIVKSCNEK